MTQVAPPGPAAIRVEASTLELNKGVSLPRGKPDVKVTFDLLGAAKASSEVVTPDRDKAELGLDASFALELGSAERGRLLDALDSESTDDSNVTFTLFATSKSARAAEPVAIGRAVTNLEKLLVEAKKDMLKVPLPLMSTDPRKPTAQIGKLTVSLLAFEALSQLDAALEKYGDAPKARAAEAKAAPPSARAVVRASATELELARNVSLPFGKGRAAVSFEMPGDKSAASAAVPVSRGRATLGFEHAVRTEPGSAPRAALLDALDADDSADAPLVEAVFTVLAADGRGGSTPFGRAAVDLEKLLDGQRDVTRKQLPLIAVDPKRKPAELGTLTVTLEALGALSEIDEALEKHGSARAVKEAEGGARGAEGAARRDRRSRADDAPAAAPAAAATEPRRRGAERPPPPREPSAAEPAPARRSQGEAAASARTAEPTRTARRPLGSTRGGASSSAAAAAASPTAETIAIEITHLELLDDGADGVPADADALVVDVDPLALPHRQTRAIALRRERGAGAYALDFSHEIPAGPSTKAREELMDALESETQEDSDVYFTLLALDARAEREVRAGKDADAVGTELGVGSLNLEQLLERGRDASEVVLGLTSKRGRRVADLTVSVRALGALRAAESALEAHGTSAKAKRVERAAVSPARSASASAAALLPRAPYVGVEIEISQVSLPRVDETVPDGVDDLEFEFDLLGVEHIKSARVPLRDDGQMPIGYRESFAVGIGTKARRELMDALESSSQEDSDIYFSLYGLDLDRSQQPQGAAARRGGAGEPSRVELGAAFVNLERILASGRDVVSEKLPIMHEDKRTGAQQVGTVTMTVRALSALRDVEASLDKHGSPREAEKAERAAFAPAPRTPPDGSAARAPASPEPADRAGARQRGARRSDDDAERSRAGGRGQPAAATSVRVEVDAFKLHSVDDVADTVDDLLVGVDLPMLDDELKTKAVPVVEKAPREHVFGFSHEQEVRPGSKARRELMTALESETQADSDVIFTVYGVDPEAPRGAEPVVIGSAALNLEELLEQDRGDAVGRALPVRTEGRSAKEVGTLTVSVRALSALKAIDRSLEQHGSLAAALKAEEAEAAGGRNTRSGGAAGRGRAAAATAAGGGAPKPVSVKVRMSQLELHDTSALPAEVDDVQLSYEFLRQAPIESSRVGVQDSGKHFFDLERDIDVSAGTRARAELMDALESSSAAATDTRFVVRGLPRGSGGRPVELGVAKLNLEGVLTSERDVRDEALPVVDASGRRVGTLTVSLSAVDALRQVDDALEKHGSARDAKAAEVRLLERPAAGAADAERGRRERGRAAAPAAPAAGAATSVRVEVDAFKLHSVDDVADTVDDLLVGVDLPMLDDELKTKAVPVVEKAPREHVFGFSHEQEVRPGSKARRELMTALESETQADSDVIFTVYGVDPEAPRGAEPVVIGSAALNLEELLEQDRGDAVGRALPVRTEGRSAKEVGTLTVSVRALSALKAIDRSLEQHGSLAAALKAEEAEAAGGRSTRSGGGAAESTRPAPAAAPPPPKPVSVKVRMSQLELHDTSALPAEVDDVQLSYEFLREAPIESSRVGVQDSGKHFFDLERDIDVSAGTRARAELMDALESSSAAATDTRFVVRGLPRGSGGRPVELGVAKLNLEGVLTSERDVRDEALPVVDASGRRVGTLTVSLSAVDALRQVDDALEKHGSARDAKAAEERAARQGGPGETRATRERRRERGAPADASRRGGADGGREPAAQAQSEIALLVSAVTLDDVGKVHQGVHELQLAVDFLGAHAEGREPRSAPVTLQDSGRHLLDNWRAALDVRAGAGAGAGGVAEGRRAVLEALEPGSAEEDSDVVLTLYGLERPPSTARPRELGTATFNLEQLLQRGREATAEAVPLLTPRPPGGGLGAQRTRIGELTLSTEALPALRALDALLEEHGDARRALAADAAPRGSGAQRGPRGSAAAEAPRTRGASRAAGGGARPSAAAAKVPADTVRISVASVELPDVDAVLPDDVDELLVGIDFLGAKELRTPVFGALEAGGLHPVGYTHDLDAGKGTATRDALLDALDSAETADSDVFFVLYAVPARADAEPVELGMAAVNLEALLDRGRDQIESRLELEPSAGGARRGGGAGRAELGSITVSVEALTALRGVDEALERYGDATRAKAAERGGGRATGRGGAQPPPGAAAGAALPLEPEAVVSVEIHELVIDDVGQLDASVDELEFEFDFLTMDDIRSGPVKVEPDGTHVVYFAKEFDVSPGTRAREALMDALESASTEDSDVYFMLHTIDRDRTDPRTGQSRRVEIGAAYANLEEMLKRGRDLLNARLKIHSTAKGRQHEVIGTVRLTIRALDAMADIDAAIDEHGSVKQAKLRERELGKSRSAASLSRTDVARYSPSAAGAREGAARTAPTRGGAASQRQGPPAAARQPYAPPPPEEEVPPPAEATIAVSKLQLSSAAQRDTAAAGALAVRVDFPGAAEPRTTTIKLPSSSGGRGGAGVPVDLSEAVDLSQGTEAGRANRKALLEALDRPADAAEDDTDVVFELLALSRPEAAAAARGEPVPRTAGRVLGVGSVSLEKILDDGADMRRAPVQLRPPGSGPSAQPVATLTADVVARDALEELDEALDKHGSAERAAQADVREARERGAARPSARGGAAQSATRRSAGGYAGGYAAGAAQPMPADPAEAKAHARAEMIERNRRQPPQPYKAMAPPARAAFGALKDDLRAGTAMGKADYAAALGSTHPARLHDSSVLAAREADAGRSLGAALGPGAALSAVALAGAPPASSGAAPARGRGSSAAAQPALAGADAGASSVLLRPIRAEGVPAVAEGYSVVARTLRLCVFDPSTAALRGNVLSVKAADGAAAPAGGAGANRGAAGGTTAWPFDKALQLLLRQAADAPADAQLLVQLDAVCVPAPGAPARAAMSGSGGADGADGAGAGRRARRAPAAPTGPFWERRRGRARPVALCWGALPLGVLAEWKPALRSAGSAAKQAVKERTVQMRRGAAFSGSGLLTAKPSAPPSSRRGGGGAAGGGGGTAAGGPTLVLGISAPSGTGTDAATLGALPAELLCELAHARMFAVQRALLAKTIGSATDLAGGADGGLLWAPHAAAFAQLAASADTLGALERVWTARLRAPSATKAKRDSASFEADTLGESAVALTLLLGARGAMERAPTDARRAELLAEAEREAKEGGKRVLTALAEPAANAAAGGTAPFRERALVLDPAAELAARRGPP